MKLAGTAYVQSDGKALVIGEKCELSGSRFKSEAVTGLSGYTGTIDKPQARKLTVELLTDESVTMAQLEAMTDVTLIVEWATGAIDTLTHCKCTGDLKRDGATGKMEVEFIEQSKGG